MSGEQGGLDLSAVISKLTENPAILSGLVSSLAAAAPPKESEKTGVTPAPDPEMLSKLLPSVSALGSGLSPNSSGQSANPRCDLLRALRPFLSRSRCEAIDYMIKMDGLSGLLQNIRK